MSADERRATLAHARQRGYCARGLRRWFVGRHYTWEQFIATGVPVAWLRATNDVMAQALADEADKATRP
jgi:hypothetical protein